MSKAFTTEDLPEPDDAIEDDGFASLPPNTKNYITPKGFAALQEELRKLVKDERPKIVEIVSWAAGNGDRSENGDYIYGKKKLREIDRRIHFLTKRLENSEAVDPAKQKNLNRVFFGATVTYARENGTEYKVTLVGVDETDPSNGKISWLSPLAKALMKKNVGDETELRTAAGSEMLEILKIEYIAG